MNSTHVLLAVNALLLVWNIALAAINLRAGSSWAIVNLVVMGMNIVAIGFCFKSLRIRREIQEIQARRR